MEFFLVMALLLALGKTNGTSEPGNANASNELGEWVASVIALVALLAFAMILTMVVTLGFVWFPLPTKCLLSLAAVAGIFSLLHWLFWSPEARTQAGYKAMKDKYDALSLHLARMEDSYYETRRAWALKKADKLLLRCNKAHAKYQHLPREEPLSMARFYDEGILVLVQRLQAQKEKAGN